MYFLESDYISRIFGPIPVLKELYIPRLPPNVADNWYETINTKFNLTPVH